jgi:hypothetical protein
VACVEVQGCPNTDYVVTWVTKFCVVVTNIFSINSADSLPSTSYAEMCSSLQALRVKYWIMVRFSGHSRIVVHGMEFASYHPYGIYNLEVSPGILENL